MEIQDEWDDCEWEWPTRHRQEVIHRGDVIHSFRQDAYLLLPLIFEHIHIVLSHFALGSGSQSQSCIDNLEGEKAKSSFAFLFLHATHSGQFITIVFRRNVDEFKIKQIPNVYDEKM